MASITDQRLAWQWWNLGTSNPTSTMVVTMQDATWQNWISNGSGTVTSTSYTAGTWSLWNQAYEETREQAAQRQARVRGQEAARAAWRSGREKATARARELLLSLLTDEQAASYTEHGWFEVRGSRGGRWRIRDRGQQGNVDLMPEIGDVREASFCCHPPGGLPSADAHLAQMLHLVTDEDEFRRTANQCYPHAA